MKWFDIQEYKWYDIDENQKSLTTLHNALFPYDRKYGLKQQRKAEKYFFKYDMSCAYKKIEIIIMT